MQACFELMCACVCSGDIAILSPMEIWQRFVDRTVKKAIFVMRSCSTCGFLFGPVLSLLDIHINNRSYFFRVIKMISTFIWIADRNMLLWILFFWNIIFSLPWMVLCTLQPNAYIRLLLLLLSQNHWLFHSATATWLHIVSFCLLKL